jgi:hypothetical protein
MSQNQFDIEKAEMLALLPDMPKTGASGYFDIPKPNCYICKSINGEGKIRIEIFPIQGGWLGTTEDKIEADIAPFHG